MTTEIDTASKKPVSLQHASQEAARSSSSPLPLDPNNAADNSRFDPSGAHICDNPKLRVPQVEGFRAACSHFSESNDPAIIQLPVGCGKSGLAGLLSLGLSTKRTLIVAPNTTIRRELFKELSSKSPTNFWSKTDVINKIADRPRVTLIDGPAATMDDCSRSDIIVTNIQQLVSSSKLWLYQFPSGFFDLIIFDEAHHTAADSWQKVIRDNSTARIVSLTATPFRTDGKPLHGEVIYRYSVANAMIKGYISQIDSASAQPSKITFTLRDERREFDLEEILEFREKAWFRRGVALSDECNRNIASKAVEKMYELREATGYPHQIIAAAMSIHHASRICEIFEDLGVTAEFIHHKLPAEDKKSVLDRLHDHSIDAVVQVAMLGEGFDHPPLGVAAIFRPYRSLSPYIQFIGRVMRTVDRKNAFGPDNRAFLVSHTGLNNEEQWGDFGLFDSDDQAVVRKLLYGKEARVDGTGTGTSDGEVVGPIAEDEDVSHFDAETFLDPSDDKVIEAMLDTAGPGGISYRDLGVTAEQLRAQLLHLRRRQEPPPAQV